MNKFLKIHVRGQTAVLSAFVLVGMMFLVPAITEKALGVIHATASGQCGPEGQTHPCDFTLVSKHLDNGCPIGSNDPCGRWMIEPTQSGTSVTWSTTGGWGPPKEGGMGKMFELPGNEKGSVTYKVGEETAVLSFENPVIGSNKCSVSGIDGSCTAGTGQNAAFTYNLRGR